MVVSSLRAIRQGQGSDVRNDIRDVVLRQGRLPGRHESALAHRLATLRDHHREGSIVDQVDVAFPRQGSDMGHEAFAAAATVDAVTPCAITLVEGLAVLGVSSEERRRREDEPGHDC